VILAACGVYANPFIIGGVTVEVTLDVNRVTARPAHASNKAQLNTTADHHEPTPRKDQQADHPANIPRKA
jgi:hypothetical protein